MSKGSKQRPTNKSKFDANYSEINWRKDAPKLTKEQIEILKKEVRKVFKTDENNA